MTSRPVRFRAYAHGVCARRRGAAAMLSLAFWAVMLAGSNGPTFAAPEPPADEVNLARGRPYTLSPAPTYSHTTDPDDLRQLTDGIAIDAFWHRKSTVGWYRTTTSPSVLIDLGRVCPIQEVRVHSVGGGRHGGLYPTSILVMVSDDNLTFRVAGATDNTGMTQDWYDRYGSPKQPHVFCMGGLQTRGRYVLVSLEPDNTTVFTDEIEVIRGLHDPADVSFDRENRFQPRDVDKLTSVLHERRGLSEIARWIENEGFHPHHPLHDRWEALRKELRLPQAVYSLHEIRRLTTELYALRGHILSESEAVRLAWAVANPMLQIAPDSDLPDAAERTKTLEIECWRGEYESAAVTLINCGTAQLQIAVSVSPLRQHGGAVYPADDCVILRQAVPVFSRSLGPVNDALVKLNNHSLILPAGQTGQLWVTFHNPALPAGTYEFELSLAPTDLAHPSVPLPPVTVASRLTVAPIDFPDRPTLNTFVAPFLSVAAFTSRYPSEAIADLRAHYVNVYSLHPNELPLPERGPDGQINVDFNAHHAALQQYAEFEQYLFFWSCSKGLSGQSKRGLRGPDRLSPEWRAVMRAWLPQWVQFLHDHGIGYDRFAMYLFDKHIQDEFAELARFIKSVDPRIRIFANNRGDKDGEFMRNAAPYVDIWCLPDLPAGHLLADHEREVRTNATTWTYHSRGPGKALPPYAYYRLRMWRAFSRGDTGCGFWKYNKRVLPHVSMWADPNYNGGPWSAIYTADDCPVDPCGEKIIPSRRWEAWREGVEDYEYLAQLQRTVDAARRSGHVSAADQADDLLAVTVNEVARDFDSPEGVYRARRAITARILDLEAN